MSEIPVVTLIACCATKKKTPDKAIDLYQSDLFKKSVKYALSYRLPIYILSAKYGLINSNRLIFPYNLTLNNFSKDDLIDWEKKVAIDIKKNFGDNPLIVLAGSKYLVFGDYCDNKIINPMRGLGIGERLHYLKSKILDALFHLLDRSFGNYFIV